VTKQHVLFFEEYVRPEGERPFAAIAEGLYSEWVFVAKERTTAQHPDLYYWFEYLPDSKTLYFNYRRCEDMKDQPFVEFNRRLFSFIDSHKVERLIIDLRDNSGGNSGDH